jgi:hypothetical protein
MATHAFPVPTKQFAAEVQGVRTEFVLQGFDNRVLVMVTQLGKVGTMLQARCVALLPPSRRRRAKRPSSRRQRADGAVVVRAKG